MDGIATGTRSVRQPLLVRENLARHTNVNKTRSFRVTICKSLTQTDQEWKTMMELCQQSHRLIAKYSSE